MPYDALLLVSFGGSESPEDVIPFLENVLRGRNVPRERMLSVAEHYYHFEGKSPINEQNRQLIAALSAELERHGPRMPIYWGNRNWHPLLPDTLQKMHQDGVRRALAFVTSAFSSYSGCRQYRENIAQAQMKVGASAPVIDKLRVFYNHPRFIAAMVDRVRAALEHLPDSVRDCALVVYTAHSIPLSMAQSCEYIKQLNEAKVFSHPIVTQVVPLKGFYAAEAYHQHFIDHNPDYPYVVYNDIPKLKQLEKQFPEWVAKR